MPQPSEFDREYIRLILNIDKHIDGYIDAYIGPEDLLAEAAAAPKRAPQQMLEDADRLTDAIPSGDPSRQAYLAATLRAARTTIEMLAGEDIPYMEEVQRIYDVMPQRVDEKSFMLAHNALDTYLPGSGSLAERFENWRNQYNTPEDMLLPALQMISDETRKRTQAIVELPQQETIDIELVKDAPWTAYNWFKGNGHSLIEFNTDVAKSALGLLSTMAHEGYPGHHTESAIKEQILWKQQGYGEAAAMLLHSPAAVVAEGIAMTAVEMIFPDHQDVQWTLENLLPAIQMPAKETLDQIWHIHEAMFQMRLVPANAAILFHTSQLDREQTVEYLQTYGLSSADRAQKSLSFITHPLYRSYPFTYTEGYDLIAKAAGSANKTDIFLECLTGQILPSQLASLAAKSAADGT